MKAAQTAMAAASLLMILNNRYIKADATDAQKKESLLCDLKRCLLKAQDVISVVSVLANRLVDILY